MKALAVIVLQFKQPAARAWKVPFNVTDRCYRMADRTGSDYSCIVCARDDQRPHKESCNHLGDGVHSCVLHGFRVIREIQSAASRHEGRANGGVPAEAE